MGKAVRKRSQGVLSPWRAESLQGSELSSVKAVTGLNNWTVLPAIFLEDPTRSL